MPAVTADLLNLPRLPDPPADPEASRSERPVVSVTTAPNAFEGLGFRCAGPSPA
jgi:hypothetical protein